MARTGGVLIIEQSDADSYTYEAAAYGPARSVGAWFPDIATKAETLKSAPAYV